jgi:hypothetical protein
MARIPTPTERGQAVGTVQSQFTPTPFQNLNPDADVFGAGQARALGQAADGLAALSTAINKGIKADDTLALTKFETKVKSQQLIENARIGSLVGQEQLDAAAEAPAAFEQFVADARAEHNFQRPDNRAAADNFSALSLSQFSATAVSASATGKAVVDKQVSTARLVTAGRNLVANPAHAEAFEDVVHTTVTDPDTGLAQALGLDPSNATYDGTDPKRLQQKKLIENMIAEQQALGLRQVVDSLVAQGDFAGALAFVDDNPQLGANTAVRTAAEAQVTTFRQKVRGEEEFSALLKELSVGGNQPSLAQLQTVISAETDVNMRGRLLAVFSIFSSAKTAVLNETVRRQGVSFMAELAAGTVTPEALAKYPEYFRRNPQAALAIATGARQRTVTQARAETAEDSAHTNNGGAAVTLPGLSTQISVLFERDPIEARKLIEGGGLKKYLGREDWAAFKEKAENAKTAEAAALTKDQNTASSVMRKSLGYSSADATNFTTAHATRLNQAITAVRQAAIDAGRPVNPDDLRKAVAEQLVKVMTADRFDFGTGARDTYDYQAAIDQSKLDEGFDPYEALLREGSRNDRAVALLFGKATDEVEAAREALDDADKGYTLNNIAAQFGVKTPPDLRDAARKEVAMDNLAVDAGYPSDFIRYVLLGTNRAEDEDTFSAAIKELQSGSVMGAATTDLLEAWANQ